MAPTDLHPLTGALGLALPAGAVVRTAPQGLSADHPTEGWRLTAFQRPATVGASPAQLHAAVLGSLAKRHPDAAAVASAAHADGPGWQGLQSLLNLPDGRALQVLTVVESGAVLVGMVLEVPAGSSVTLQPASWLRAAATATPAPAKPRLSLAPLEGEAPPAMAAAKPALSLAPLEGEAAPAPAKPRLSLAPLEGEAPPVVAKPTLSLAPLEGATPPTAAPAKPALSLAPVEGDSSAPSPPPAVVSRASFKLADADAEPAAASPPPGAARARFGAREPSAGPVASSLQPVAPPKPPPPAANPYEPPETVALEAEAGADPEALRAAGRGQQVLIWCVLLSIAARGLYRNPEIPMLVNWTIAVALMAWAFHGVLLIASGFGYGRGAKLGLLFGSTVPLLGIGLWIWLSMKTTRALRAAGHTVGFFGVKS